MPISAMPEHLNTREKIEAAFPDDSDFGDSLFGRLYKRYQKFTKTWFAFSYRCTEWWAKWRPYPILLFAIGGGGAWRWEPIQPGKYDVYDFDRHADQPAFYYLSRIQYYKRWHLAIQWPLILSLHVYFKATDVPVLGKPVPETDDKLFFFYWNHFDADMIYWMLTSVFIGLCWK